MAEKTASTKENSSRGPDTARSWTSKKVWARLGQLKKERKKNPSEETLQLDKNRLTKIRYRKDTV